jgi:hypothetical protein
MTAPDQFCSNFRKFLPRHVLTPLRRARLTTSNNLERPNGGSIF